MSMNISSNNINFFNNNPINKLERKHNINNNSKKELDENKSNSIKLQKKQSQFMESLLKQKQSFLEQKQSLLAKDMDADEKKYKIAEVNKNIENIEAQIQQVAIQERQAEIEKQKEKEQKKRLEEEKNKKNYAETNEDVIISASLNELIKLNSTKENIHLLKDSKNRQAIDAQYIKPNDNPNSYNNKRLANISKSISSIDATISTKVVELVKTANKINDKTELLIERNETIEKKKEDDEIKNNQNVENDQDK